MCLLFFNLNDCCNSDEFRLVLVNNRDEYWNRPTKPADFGANDLACISGLDEEPGREGGTWLGANRQGRVACLVNIPDHFHPDKRGRGMLVTDFLTKAETIESYAKEVSSQREQYNGFILTLIQLGQPNSKVVRVTNDSLCDEPFHMFHPTADDYFSVGNSHVKCPWRKVCEGQKKFEQIVKAHPSLSTKEKLKEELFHMMADRFRYTPDVQLEKQGHICGWDEETVLSKSAMFVWDPRRQHGTRTTTVLLIDSSGNCEYTEKTMEVPVDVNKPQWSVSQHHYKLQFSL